MDPEVHLVKYWMEKVVIGLNFCPFAAKPFYRNKISYYVHHEPDIPSCIKQFYAVLRALQEEPAEVLETAFIIYPRTFQDFNEYLQFVQLLQRFLEMNQMEAEFQLASFHPEYQFKGTSSDDVTNNTNKSPFPIVHILRSESILQARLSYGNTLKIPKLNIDRLRSMGLEGWKEYCIENSLSL